MNYASTNEPENHDNDFPVMTGDDIADMVCGKQGGSMSNEIGTREHYEEYVQDCEDAGIMPVSWTMWQIQYPQPVASAPASVGRLEDLEPRLMAAMLEISKGNADVDVNLWESLFAIGLVDYCTDDTYADTLTARSAALVRDYQRRQAAQDELDMLTYEAVMHKPDPMRTVDRKEHNAQVATLKAENARLQSDLEAAVEVMIKAGNDMQALRDAVSFTQVKLAEIDKRGKFTASDLFTLTDILDVLGQVNKDRY